MTVQFPEAFLWGAATSAHQIEGNNANSDWWQWERKSGLKEISGAACRHYEVYQADFDLAQSLEHNAHRLSIEWSRIQPGPGEFSEQEIRHYKDVILSLRQRNIEPVVTLHHFTNPLWFAALGGWENENAPGYFLAYIERVVEALAADIRYWITINEPITYIYHAYILGVWPPQKKSFLAAKKIEHNLAVSHINAYRMIHDIYRRKKLSPPRVSIAQNLQAFVACRPTLKNRLAVYLREWLYNFGFIERLIRQRALDFIGINYYGRNLADVEKWGFKNLLLDTCRHNHHPVEKNSLGWDIYPEGLGQLLRKLNRYNLPVLITENGICIEDDNQRWKFIRGHLQQVAEAIQQGVKIIGYLYWSLIDNFEWDKGFGPRFGLIEVDYQTYQRRVRQSARNLALVCKTGVLA
jgi:beta-glucosidase